MARLDNLWAHNSDHDDYLPNPHFRYLQTSGDSNYSINEHSSNLNIIVNESTVGEYQCIAWWGSSGLASVTGQLILAAISLPGS